jgi:hypothetical protein
MQSRNDPIRWRNQILYEQFFNYVQIDARFKIDVAVFFGEYGFCVFFYLIGV